MTYSKNPDLMAKAIQEYDDGVEQIGKAPNDARQKLISARETFQQCANESDEEAKRYLGLAQQALDKL